MCLTSSECEEDELRVCPGFHHEMLLNFVSLFEVVGWLSGKGRRSLLSVMD